MLNGHCVRLYLFCPVLNVTLNILSMCYPSFPSFLIIIDAIGGQYVPCWKSKLDVETGPFPYEKLKSRAEGEKDNWYFYIVKTSVLTKTGIQC